MTRNATSMRDEVSTGGWWDSAMTILRDRYGWDERRITGRYVTLSWACLAAVLGAWGAALVRRRDEAREALRRG